MKRWMGAALTTAVIAATPASALGYVQGSAGLTSVPWFDIRGMSYKLNNGFNIGVSGGLNLANLLGPSWDVRGDILYNRNRYGCCRARLGAASFTANLIYHFDLGLPLKPYIGAGLGAVAVRFGNKLVGPNDGSTRFGAQALAGAEFPLMGRLSMFGEYRYIGTNRTQVAGLGAVDYQSHNFMLGLKLSL